MALPVTISGIATGVAPVGPYKSSGGAFYFIGMDSGAADQLQCQKATDPTSSWSAVGSDPVMTSNKDVQFISAFQVADVIHVATVSADSSTSVDFRYHTFNMATDAWVTTNETIQAAINPTDSGILGALYRAFITVRSDGSLIVFYNGARTASMGASYSRAVYARKVSGAWTTNVAVGSGGAADDWIYSNTLGSSDRSNFFWTQSISPRVRVLNSSNALQTVVVAGLLSHSNVDSPVGGLSYSYAGATRIFLASPNGTSSIGLQYYDSADVPSLSSVIDIGTFEGCPIRFFSDGSNAWTLAANVSGDGDVYAYISIDGGGSWSSAYLAMTAVVQLPYADKLSYYGAIYQSGANIVIPYIVNDNGTLKYNEFALGMPIMPQILL